MREDLQQAVRELHETDPRREAWNLFEVVGSSQRPNKFEIEKVDLPEVECEEFEADDDAATYVAERLMEVHGGNRWADHPSCAQCRLCLIRALYP